MPKSKRLKRKRRSLLTTTTIRATSGGNFTVPALLRKVAGIKEGQSLVVSVYANKKIVIEPLDLSHNEERINNSAEKARGEFGDKSAKKFKTAKGAIDYLHSL